jgi:hypothetical protein
MHCIKSEFVLNYCETSLPPVALVLDAALAIRSAIADKKGILIFTLDGIAHK